MAIQHDFVAENHGDGQKGENSEKKNSFDAIIIGAGFSGLRMLYELKKQGLTGRVFETGSGVGGTWYWNRYPGARTDSESWIYIFTFLEEIGLEWDWKERFPRQAEVEQYLNEVTDYLNLRKDIQFNTRIAAAHRDDKKNVWIVTTAQGETFTCKFLITASGPLATPIKPPYPGLESYQGEWYQTGLWPKHKVDFIGKRVALIGTGATGIQVAPVVALSAESLTVFQRTPNYVIPARNHPLMEDQMEDIKRNYRKVFSRARNQVYGFDMIDSTLKFNDVKDELEVQRVLEFGWEKGGFRYIFETFSDIILDPKSNQAASEFVCNKIRAIVQDKKTAELLCPNYPIVSKRPPVGHHYYEVFNRSNVELVDIKNDPIQEITKNGLKTGSKEYEFDIIIFALGFDAITGSLEQIDIRGSQGQKLRDVLKTKLQTSYGITIPAFPNLFMLFGPQAPFANGPLITDATADWVGKTLSYMNANHYERIESTEEGAEKWSEHVNVVFESTIISESAKDVGAWTVGGNVESKEKRILFYLGGVPAYLSALDGEFKDGYPGHRFFALEQSK